MSARCEVRPSMFAFTLEFTKATNKCRTIQFCFKFTFTRNCLHIKFAFLDTTICHNSVDRPLPKWLLFCKFAEKAVHCWLNWLFNAFIAYHKNKIKADIRWCLWWRELYPSEPDIWFSNSHYLHCKQERAKNAPMQSFCKEVHLAENSRLEK